ncbi:Predicted nucleic acid-binding protein, contains PIN domain [Treponema bryantii]|uniref:Predicted nucleic acid-binding protein, contains PIN domain n=1 Tax=Treponema bryantii TaxID=163 RepID=A0A1H9FL41_9SPIR|nr:PIN domain-containing protein [Treponema bryantii]SEQ38614.1 Predicted nucleic acid-binding protein, contains PIN domain [Treponema bryantii]
MKDKKSDQTVTESNKIFFDTNILVYSVDENDLQKKEIASQLLTDASSSKSGIISTQSLQEFYNVAVKKLKLSKQIAKEYVELFSSQLTVRQVTVPLILNAIDISIKNKLSFWDSLILSSANDNGCIIVYSEDLNNGQIVGGTKILNPFTSV